MNARDRLRVGILGGGAIGSHVGVRASAGGLEVAIVDRPERVAAGPPGVAKTHGGEVCRPGADLTISADVRDLADVDICLLAVKSGDSVAAGGALVDVLAAQVPVVSLQNGLRNVGRLREMFPNVVPAVVGFNVVVDDDGGTVEAVGGSLYLGEGRDAPTRAALRALQDALRATGLDVEIRNDIEAVATGKLLLNLNNGVGGATGLSISQMLDDADARACFSACVFEGRRVLAAAGRSVARAGPLGAGAVATAMRLPTWLIRGVQRFATTVDRSAVTSTLRDLQLGRRTEIDELNGEIVRLARLHGLLAPCNAVVVEAVHGHESVIARGQSPRWLSPAALRRRITSRRAQCDDLAAR